jgi:hypothetical protein
MGGHPAQFIEFPCEMVFSGDQTDTPFQHERSFYADSEKESVIHDDRPSAAQSN